MSNSEKIVRGTLLGSLLACLLLAASFLSPHLIPPGYISLLLATAALTGVYFVHRIRQGKLDVAKVIKNLEQIGNGDFDTNCDVTRSPELSKIKYAVDRLAARVKLTTERLSDSAQRDALTGLPNRNYFQQCVERKMDLAHASGSQSYLFFIDLDGFKSVNDTLGHNYGDRLLQMAADRLKLVTRLEEIVGESVSDAASCETVNLARLGGDEFTVFINDAASEKTVLKVAARIQRVLSEPFELGAHTATVSASIGIAIWPMHADSYHGLLRAADTAMYHAKRSGENRLEIYSESLDEEVRHRAEWEQELHEALAKGELELFYQPLYDCRTLKISSAEALIRWRHPRHGMILPGEFIPMAEKSTLIRQIGEWVVVEAVKLIAEFSEAGMPLRISINVSPSQLEQMEFISLVKATLQHSKAPPNLLELEITESIAMRDAELAADRLTRISKLGVSIAIDDFGTGYSNLASLIRLPFSRLKIDRSLLNDLTVRPDARVLVQTIISMANGLGFHTVAEGVENKRQLELLSAMGCDVVQGYLLSRPVDEVEFRKLLAEENAQDMLNKKVADAA
jgi:diguanylate cyclase (GGDEF)-like protein